MRGFKIAHLNIRSLVKIIDRFRLYLHNQQFDIVSLNETMLDDSIPDNEIYLNGYDLIRKDRNRNGDGVAIYVRSIIDYKLRINLMADDLETITVEISKPRSKSFLINTWYRPPDSPIELFGVYGEYVKRWTLKTKK